MSSETSFSGFVQLAGNPGTLPRLDFGQAVSGSTSTQPSPDFRQSVPKTALKYTEFTKDPFETLLGSIMWYSNVVGYAQEAGVVQEHNLFVRARRETGWLISADFYTRLSSIILPHMKEELKKAQAKAANGSSIDTITEATGTWIRCNSSASGLVALVEEFVEQSIREGLTSVEVPELDDYSAQLVSDWRTAMGIHYRLHNTENGTRTLYEGERYEISIQRPLIRDYVHSLERQMTHYCPLMLMVLREEFKPI